MASPYYLIGGLNLLRSHIIGAHLHLLETPWHIGTEINPQDDLSLLGLMLVSVTS